MRILAIDPGYGRVGMAVLDKEKTLSLLFSQCLNTSKDAEFSDRLKVIIIEVDRLIQEYVPTVLAIENLFFNTNQKTALRVAEARGAIISTATKHNLKIMEYTPLQIKIAVTGYGRSDKKSVINMIPKLIHCPNPIQYDDEYDAIAAGITCAAHIRDTQ